MSARKERRAASGLAALAALAALFLASVAPEARAADDAVPPGAEPAWESAEPERRGGFALGISGGLGLSAASGFPNDATKIGREEFRSETGVGAGPSGGFWLGGALADWLNFGAGLSHFGFSKGDVALSSTAFVFHADLFPLFSLGGPFRDLGLALEAGLGSAKAERGPRAPIDAGFGSRVAAGAFWEGLRFSRFALAPLLQLDHAFSFSAAATSLRLGLRAALYTGP